MPTVAATACYIDNVNHVGGSIMFNQFIHHVETTKIQGPEGSRGTFTCGLTWGLLRAAMISCAFSRRCKRRVARSQKESIKLRLWEPAVELS